LALKSKSLSEMSYMWRKRVWDGWTGTGKD